MGVGKQDIKVLAEISINRLLLRGTKVKFEGRKAWVDFKYENLAAFCFYCGRVGHVEKSCGVRKKDVNVGEVEEGQFGEWLRANRRIAGIKHAGKGESGSKEERVTQNSEGGILDNRKRKREKRRLVRKRGRKRGRVMVREE